MTVTIKEPSWKKDWDAKQEDEARDPRGNPSWRKGMKSPNPKGRPKGIVDKRQRISLALLEDAHDIARVIVAKAKEGDLHAGSLVLSRVLPALSSQAEKVQFDLDPTAPLATQVEQVLTAMSAGELSPDTARQIIETIGALGSIRQMDEIEQRLAQLEAHDGASA